MGSWDEYYELRHSFDTVEKDLMAKFTKLQSDFHEYVYLLKEFERKLDLVSINPKIFGVRLTGALIKTIAATTFSVVVAIIKFLFF